jgi:isopenicillin-N epimerase
VNQNLRSLFLLDEDVIFLNHGSFGACPRPVFEAYQAWQLKLERQPVAFLDPDRGLSSWMRDARSVLAAELGTGADNLVGMMNATYALNVVAQSLDLKEGDEILTTDHEYAALEKTWSYVARRTGARIVVVNIPLPLNKEPDFTESLRTGFTNRTRVLFLSHITSATALLFPIEKIVAEARGRGIYTVIDGAHTPGHIPLNLDALGADFYAGNCHKWLMAPKGSAFLHVRPGLQAMINPLVISHGWTINQQNPGPFGNTPFVDSLEMQGTRDPSAWLSVPTAIAFRTSHQWDKVAEDCRRLAWDTATRVAALTQLSPFCSSQFCAPQMVAMPVPNCDPKILKSVLLDKHSIEIPCFQWKDHTIVRLSVQGYNTQSQMNRLGDALLDLIPNISDVAEDRVFSK